MPLIIFLLSKIIFETSTEVISFLNISKSLLLPTGNSIPAIPARPPNPPRLGPLSVSPTGFKLYSTVYFLSVL